MKPQREREPLYWLLWYLFRLAFRIFFARIHVRHFERIPESGPVIFASNHPNDLIDPLIIGSIAPRRIDFVAKNTLFNLGPLGPIFRRFGVIPVYRRQDVDPDEADAIYEKNLGMFDACRKVLAGDGAITMFPEGVSHRDPQIKRLKTGTARIALQTEAAHGFTLGIVILPVGLTFSRWNRFRSDVLIHIGRPISVLSYREQYHRAPEETVRRLTAALERALRALTFHTQEVELALLAKGIHDLFQDRIAAPGERAHRLLQEKEILRAIHFFQRTDPKWVAAFRERMDQYRHRLLALGIRDRILSGRTSVTSALALLSKGAALGLIGFPIALFGMINNYLPYRLPTVIARRLSGLNAEATLKFFSGVFLFPLFYTVQTLGVGLLFGPWTALLYLSLLPPTGLYAFHYWIRLRRTRDQIYLVLAHLSRSGVIEELQKVREALIAELEKRQKIYVHMRNRIRSD